MRLVQHPVFTPPTDPSVALWRYMDLAKYVAMLEHKALFFPTADRLGDKLEGTYPTANRTVRAGMYRENEEDLLRMRREQLQRDTLISCWHMNPAESAAMWRLYGREDYGIAVRTTYQDLVASVIEDPRDKREAYAGVVRYIDFTRDVIDESNHLSPFIHKRKSFEYEHEVRLVVVGRYNPGARLRRVSSSAGDYIAVELSKLVAAVYVAPSSSSWFQGVVQSVTTKYGLDTKVQRSSMDTAPFI